jgi:hypothetical protein
MNRRNRKKKQSSPWEELINRLKQADFTRLTADKLTFWYNLPTFHRRALLVLIPVLLILFVIPVPEPEPEPEYEPDTPSRVEVSVNTTSLSEQPNTLETSQSPGTQVDSGDLPAKRVVTRNGSWKEYTVQTGDTLAKVFRANELSMSDLNELVKIEGLDKPLSKIQAGQLIRYKLTAKGQLDILQLEKNGASVMFFRLSDGGFGRSK